MIADNHHNSAEQELIQRIRATIAERVTVAKTLSAAPLQDQAFNQARFAEMANDLALAHSTIVMLSDQLNAILNAPPDEVTNALRSTSGRPRAVRQEIGGILRTFLVPSFGRVDPVAEARWWRRITEQYGNACL